MPNNLEREITALPFTWNPGEHMSIVGDTGSGKSTLARALLNLRRYTLICRTKTDDVIYPVQIRSKTSAPMRDRRYNRIELFPPKPSRAHEFVNAYEQAYAQGGWTVYIDELFVHSVKLGLDEWIDELLTQGRSLGITVVTGMQRPVQVTRFAMAESLHLLSFSLEGRDVKILREVAPRLSEFVPNLRRYQFAWFYRPTKQIWVGKVQDLMGGEIHSEDADSQERKDR